MTDADPTPTPPTASAAAAAGPPGVPRWVKLSGLVILVLVAILVASKVAGVEHGPGRHSGSDDSPGHTQPAGSGGHTGPPSGITHGSP